MLVIENTVVSENIFRAKFLCDLERCRGACCVEGVVGAPLEDHERTKIDHYLPLIISTLSEAAREVIAKEGAYVWDQEYGLVTPTIKGEFVFMVCIIQLLVRLNVLFSGIMLKMVVIFLSQSLVIFILFG